MYRLNIKKGFHPVITEQYLRRYLKKYLRYVFVSLVILLTACTTNKSTLTIATFSDNNLSKWQERVFNNKTHYTLVDDNGIRVLRADSKHSASALYQQIDVDLTKTPFLNWRWKITDTFDGNDEKTKTGDDYPVRLYVVFPGSGFSFTPRSLTYVWSNTADFNSHWYNPYSDDVIMLALENGSQKAGQWVMEKRNVMADLEERFGEPIKSIIGLAIMTDTDNTKVEATSYYGDIYFSAK